MLDVLGYGSLDELIDATVPDDIRLARELDLPEAMSEYELLGELRRIADMNTPARSFIGLGYYVLGELSANSREVFAPDPVIAAWAPSGVLIAITALAIARLP